ncbi:MAG: hypothetical protein B6I19_08465 [Bacteroidetes bacterium 4572_114]|nr:MAG: hypothetical protein B6I19_08465 [Bacteroidetes bacterium 4572_114]
MQKTIQTPLTNLQLELLKLFTKPISEDDLLEIKDFLVQYFANKAMDLADKVWDENKWDKEDETKFLTGHLRTPYKHEQSEIGNL